MDQSVKLHQVQPFHYCYFSFRGDHGQKHELRVRVTASLGLEWHLYVNDQEVGYYIDNEVNIVMADRLADALSYHSVIRIYTELLSKHVNI